MSTPIVNAIIGKASENSYQYKQVVLIGGGTFSDQVTEPNTKYIIKYDFDLEGQTITMPANCILAFDGGQIKNGTIVTNDTTLLNLNKVDNIFNNVTIQGNWKLVSQQFTDSTDNLSVVYFDKNTRKFLWWDNDQRQFFEIITV